MPLLTFKDLGQLGIIKDMLDTEIPDNAWTDGNNIVFRDNVAQKIPGDIQIFTGQNDYSPEALLFYPDPQSGTAYWLYPGYDITDMRILSIDAAGGEVDLSGVDVGDPYALNHAGWTKGVVSGVPFFNNGTDAPWLWLRATDGVNLDSTMTQMTTWPAGMVAEQLRAFRNFYIAMDITEAGGPRNPSRLMWSTPAEPYQEPADWNVADPASLSGDTTIGDSGDYIMDCLPLRGNNIVYKRNETWMMRRVNSASVFAFDRLFKEVGLLAPRCVAALKGTYHFMATNNKDIIIHDGNTRESICDSKVREAIFNDIEEEGLTRCFVATNRTQEEVWFCYPSLGNTEACNKAAIWNYENSTWSFRDLDNATDMAFGIPNVQTSDAGDQWDTGPNEQWDTGVDIPWATFYNATITSSDIQSQNTRFVKLDETFKFHDNAYTTFIEKSGIDFGMPQRRKSIRSIIPKIRGNPVKITVGGSSNIGGPYTYAQAVVYDPANDYKVDVRFNARYFSVRFESDEEFRIYEFTVDAVERGIR